MNMQTMDFNFPRDSKSIIKVIGVGGGGGNAVNHMYNSGIRDVEFLICNTDAQVLDLSPIPNKIQLGLTLTQGLGAGRDPQIGREAAIESIEDIKNQLSDGTKMVFVTVGMGGGTGTGAAAVIAQVAKELDILTIGIATIPFKFEGKTRIKQAMKGIQELNQYVDSLLVINNERLISIHEEITTKEAYAIADDILLTAAKGIAEIITVPGHINVDFADVRTVMGNSGVALMGTGVAGGENRAIEAVKQAISSPLLSNNDILGAKEMLLNIISGEKGATMSEIKEISKYIKDLAGNQVDIIMGEGEKAELGDQISVTIIATGFKDNSIDSLVAVNQSNENEELTIEINLDAEKTKEPEDLEQEKINELYGDTRADVVSLDDVEILSEPEKQIFEEGDERNKEREIDHFYDEPAFVRKKRKLRKD